MKYRVGDKVRLNEEAKRRFGFEECIIVSIDEDDSGGYPYFVDYGDGLRNWMHGGEFIDVTPRIDPAIITRLNEVVTMLIREKRRYGLKRSYRRKAYEAAIQRFGEDSAYTKGEYAQVENIVAEYERIVARIDAMTKVIEELTKEER